MLSDTHYLRLDIAIDFLEFYTNTHNVRTSRAVGTLNDPYDLRIFLLFPAFFAFSQMVRGKNPYSWKWSLLFGGVLISILLTQSRSVILVLPLAFGYLITLLFFGSSREDRRRLYQILLLVLTLGMLTVPLLGEGLTSINSAATRVKKWKLAIYLVKYQLIFGMVLQRTPFHTYGITI